MEENMEEKPLSPKGEWRRNPYPLKGEMKKNLAKISREIVV
jgi:hypothetical protein